MKQNTDYLIQLSAVVDDKNKVIKYASDVLPTSDSVPLSTPIVSDINPESVEAGSTPITLEGVITDSADKKPIEGADITVYAKPSGILAFGSKEIAQAKSDENGNYTLSFTKESKKQYSIKVKKASYLSESTPLNTDTPKVIVDAIKLSKTPSYLYWLIGLGLLGLILGASWILIRRRRNTIRI